MAPCNSYPKFEKNQVLTAEQLNQLAGYLQSMGLRTRAKLIGIGPVCGLDVSHTDGASPSLILTRGVGITSEGFLIEIDDYVATRNLTYHDPVFYPPFWHGDTQIDLWQLLSNDDFEEGDGSQVLTAQFLKDKAVLLYLEVRDVDLETCTGADCDEQGIRVELCVKKLLIKQADLQGLIESAYGFKSGSDLDRIFNARYDLPQIEIGREAGLLQLGDGITYQDLHKFYLNLIDPLIKVLSNVLEKSYAAYAAFLAAQFKNNPFDGSTLLKAFTQLVKVHPRHGQYLYDYFKDLTLAYDEFRSVAFDLTAVCSPDAGLFARHLMLGPALSEANCRPSVYRQPFLPAPVCDDHEQRLAQARMLFMRLSLLVKNFLIPDYQKGHIRITPSKEKGTRLSLRSIPYYYSPKAALNDYWDFELRRRCQSDLVLSYHADQWAPAGLPFVYDPLAFDCDPYPFFRIEGHIGGSWPEVSLELENLIQSFNLPIKVIGLSLAGKAALRQAEAAQIEDQQSRLKLALDLLNLDQAEFNKFIQREKGSTQAGISQKVGITPAPTDSRVGVSAMPQDLSALSDRVAGPVIPTAAQPIAATAKEDQKTLGCRFEDLEAVYVFCRSALLCLLKNEVDFFTGLKIGTKAPTYAAGVTGISGTIRDAAGLPIEGAEVVVMDSRFNKAITKVASDAAGKFDIRDLPPENYYLAVNYKNLEVMKDLVTVKDQETMGVDIRFEADPEAVEKASKYTVGGSSVDTRAAGMIGLAVKSAIKPGNPTTKPLSPTIAPQSSPSVLLPGESEVKMAVRREVFLDESLEKPAPKNTVGEFLKDAKASDQRADTLDYTYEYFAKHPFLEKKDIPAAFAREINSPINLITAINALVEILAEELKDFNLDLFEQRHAGIVKTALTYKQEILDDLKDPTTNPRGDEPEIIEHLNYLIEDCSLEQFQTLVKLYQQRLLEVQKLERFSDFVRLHPGLEHLAGVPRGGTFIVVYDENGTVVADFALSYICCSDCPPITTVCTTSPVVFKLPRSRFCNDDETEYKFILSPPGGLVSGPGVRRADATGDYFFLPSHTDVISGEIGFEYQIDDHAEGLVVEVIEVKAAIGYVIQSLDRETERAVVKFSAKPEDAQAYQWDFGDGGKAAEAVVEHAYDISEIDTFTIRLTITKEDCESQAELVLDLVECSAEFNHEITAQDGATAQVQFTAVHQDQETYQWDFGDGQTAAEANPLHEFDLAQKQTYNISLSVVRGDCTDQQTQPLTFEICSAAFSHEVVEPGSQTATVQFAAEMTDADTYQWNFGDGNASDESQPVHKFDISESRNFTVTLQVTKGVCRNQQELPLVFDLCSAEFNHTVVERDAGSAQVQFTAVMSDADTYQWDFGDGNTSKLPNPVNVYDLGEDRSYNVTLKVGKGTCADQQSRTLEFEVCSAEFSYTVEKSDLQTAQVRFIAQMPDADKYQWDFGDGSSSDQANPVHVFDIREVQLFNVSLKVAKGTCVDQQTKRIEIEVCSADFSYKIAASDGKTAKVQFTAAMAKADVYKWDFGDGNGASEANPVHSFDIREVQSYNVRLIVATATCKDQQEQRITLAACNAGFTHKVMETDGKTARVQFTAVMPDADKYQWDFGDGNKAVEANPEHVFDIREIQSFSVTLRVATEFCEDQQTQKIAIG